jgi:hypothetical protein
MVSGVRSAGLTYQGQKNNFNIAAAGLGQQGAIAEYNAAEQKSGQQASAQGNFFGNLISSGMTLGAMGSYLKAGQPAQTAGTPTLDMGKADILAPSKSKYLNYEYPYGRN